MNIPEDLLYTKDHEWVRLEGAEAVVGITEFAQGELGELVFVDLPGAGKKVKQRETLCVVESTKAASDVYSPLSGAVKEVNPGLAQSPALVNTHPYSEGWLVRLQALTAGEEKSLLTPVAYRALVTK
jgi:glycine cleavage system H protein